jgi:hypothetical protein
MITTVYFENSEGHKVVVAAFLMAYDAKVFIDKQEDFRQLQMQDLSLDAWVGWKVIVNETNKAGSSSLRSAAEGKKEKTHE